MNTQKLKELFVEWQSAKVDSHYPTITFEESDMLEAFFSALNDRLEATERERGELQEQVRALAAENKRAIDAVTVFSNVTHEITEIICDEIGQDKVAEILAAYNDIGNTPATDATIREVREQAVNGFSEFCGDNSVFIKETCNYDSLADAAYIYLARIREGEQL